MAHATKKQHFIPKLILKKHTYFQIPMKTPMLYRYEKITQCERFSSPEEVCWKKNLYEFRDEFGNILESERNLIEKRFNILETQWDRVIRRKMMNQELTNEDIVWLYLLMSLQIIRTPEIIELSKNSFQKLDPTLSEYQAERYARMASFVFDTMEKEVNWILDIILRQISTKYIAFYHSAIPFLLNEKRPVLCLRDHKGCGPEKADFFFPITSNLCLCMLTNKPLENDINISDEFARFLNKQIFNNDGNVIFSAESIKKRVSKGSLIGL